jgi:hypothetical protein
MRRADEGRRPAFLRAGAVQARIGYRQKTLFVMRQRRRHLGGVNIDSAGKLTLI